VTLIQLKSHKQDSMSLNADTFDVDDVDPSSIFTDADEYYHLQTLTEFERKSIIADRMEQIWNHHLMMKAMKLSGKESKEDPKADNCITDGQAVTSNNDVLPDNEQCKYSTVIEPPETFHTVMDEGTQVPPETLDTVMDEGTQVLEEMSRPVQERSEFTEEVPRRVEEAFEVSDTLPSSVDRPALPMDLALKRGGGR